MVSSWPYAQKLGIYRRMQTSLKSFSDLHGNGSLRQLFKVHFGQSVEKGTLHHLKKAMKNRF
jgi:hypothetical protein